MSWVRNALVSGEQALQQRLTDIRLRAARRRAASPVEPDYFRGRRCHCPEGLDVHLLHSEALREACDFVVDLGANVTHPARAAWPVPALAPLIAKLKPSATIHLKTDHLDAFAQHLLPALQTQVVLVSGDSDAPFGPEHRHLLDHPKIAHWFAQNATCAPHPKLTKIPIGIDNPVYTKLDKRLGFALTVALGKTPFDPTLTRNDMGDQVTLQAVARTLPPTRERPARALATFHVNQKLIKPDLSNFPERREAHAALHANPACSFVPKRLAQLACWRLHGEFAFQLSPRGNGLDCFRTWESLFLGVIPIVKSSPLDELYRREQLPVVVVEDFREVTEHKLTAWHAELAPRFTARLQEQLTFEYWWRKVEVARRDAREELSC